jgi:hypothetical protein
MTYQGWLTAHGRMPWEHARKLLAGATCAWADLDGFHAEPVSALPPIATHMWAWSDGRAWRARIDEDDAVIGELAFTATPGSERVTVIERAANTWPESEGRVSVDRRWRGHRTTLYEVIGLMPLTFARIDIDDPPM